MPDIPTPLDLDAIRARASDATEGPWVVNGPDERWAAISSGPDSVIHAYVPPCADGEVCPCGDTADVMISVEDAEFIAHARTDMPALVAEVERLRAEVATERAEVTRLRTMVGDCHCDKNPDTTNGPEEDCPQHGRPVAEVWDLVKRVEAGWDHARAEVDRLCAEARLANASARPAPVWDEEAVVEAVAATLAAHPWSAMLGGCAPRSGCDWRGGDTEDEQDRHAAHVANLVLAVVREHLPVKPDRDAVVRAIFDAEYPDIAEAERDAEWGIITSAGHGSAWHRQADAVLDLWPGESRATVQAEMTNPHRAAEGGAS